MARHGHSPPPTTSDSDRHDVAIRQPASDSRPWCLPVFNMIIACLFTIWGFSPSSRGGAGLQVEGTVFLESGKRDERPELAKAVRDAKRSKSILLIAKLDRLARKVHFISGMMEANIEFVAVDLPFANRLTLHILAAVAEDEATRISERTRAALQAAKRRGVKLGSPIAAKTIAAARVTRSAYAAEAAAPTKMVIADIQAAGVTSLSGIARALQARGIKTSAGKDVWHARQVSRLVKHP